MLEICILNVIFCFYRAENNLWYDIKTVYACINLLLFDLNIFCAKLTQIDLLWLDKSELNGFNCFVTV